MSVKSLSVFFPTYNEQDSIDLTIEKAVKVLQGLNLEWEILIINDGSKDKTEEIAKKIVSKNENIRLINHETNLGYGHALKTGFTAAKYPWVAFADSDGQFDFSEVSKLLDKADGSDLVLGYRLNRADPFIRRIFTFGWKTLAMVILGLNVRDYSCGFKLIKKQVFESILPLDAEEKVTQIEMLVKSQRMGFKFAEVGVHHYPRRFGVATGANLNVVFKSLIDLLKLWWKLNFKDITSSRSTTSTT